MAHLFDSLPPLALANELLNFFLADSGKANLSTESSRPLRRGVFDTRSTSYSEDDLHIAY